MKGRRKKVRRVGVRMLVRRWETTRKVYILLVPACAQWGDWCVIETYGVFPRAPKALYHAQVVERDNGGQDLSGVGVAELEDEGAPCLVVGPEVGGDVDVEVVLDVEEAGCDGGGDEAQHEGPRHRRIGKGHVADGAMRYRNMSRG